MFMRIINDAKCEAANFRRCDVISAAVYLPVRNCVTPEVMNECSSTPFFLSLGFDGTLARNINQDYM